MICLLNFCHKDRDQALNLLQWIGELGGCKGHDLILQSSITAAANGLVSELEVAAHDLFDNVTTRVTDIQDERGWPYSCNTAWLDAVMFMRYRPARPWKHVKIEHPPNTSKWKEEVAEAAKKLTVPWFWMEPDCVPLPTSDGRPFLSHIQDAYTECSTRKSQPKYLMGGEVKQPEHRMSGIGVYPCKVAEFTRGLPHLANNPAPWDQVLAPDFAPFVEYTPLIQNVWNWIPGDKDSSPRFPQVSSLSVIDPSAVLFHRCKDGSLIERLREKKSLGEKAISDERFSQDSENSKADLVPIEVRAREAELLAEIERLKARQLNAHDAERGKLRKVPAPKKPYSRKQFRGKRQRTPQQIEADRARMAKVRAARLSKA